LRIEARYHNIHGDQVAEEAAWARLVDMGRDHISYSNMLLGMGRFAEAEAMARRGIAVDATAPIAYWNLAEAQVAQLRFAAADSTAVISVANLPENNYRFFIPLAVRWGRRDLDAVEAYLNSPEAVGLPAPRAAADRCLLELHRGRLRAWQKCRVQEQPVYLQPLLMLAEFRMNRDTVRAHAGYETFLASTPAQRNQDRYGLLIALLAEVGHVREAEQLLNEWRVRTGPDDPGFRADSALALGAIAAAQAQWDRAVAAYLAWNKAPVASAIHIYNRGLPEAAAILARLGQADSAVVLFERALATSSTYGGSFYEAGWYAQALLLLGELYEARGDRARAGDYYRQYIERLAAADPPLAAQVAAVRQRLARMSEDPQRSGRGS
jgi:tetratricopeptide (TPR) repeat protein